MTAKMAARTVGWTLCAAALILAGSTHVALAAEPATTAAAEGESADEPANTLKPGESLREGESIRSANGTFEFALQNDGNLVMYVTAGSRDTAVWDTRSMGRRQRRLIMQHDGNLVLYELRGSRSRALWHSRTHGSPGAFLTLRDDGVLAVESSQGRVLWSISVAPPDVELDGIKHIIYGRSAQRVWLVAADGSLYDSYPVSGRATTPKPGRYRVFSKSVNALSFEPGVTMTHMVRFARGSSGAAIGLHSIPEKDGVPIQSEAALGQYRSAGCVRQRNDKAVRLYEWAPIGTRVVVVA